MWHFHPEVERCIKEIYAHEGGVMLDRHPVCDIDSALTIPDDLGGQRESEAHEELLEDGGVVLKML